VNAVLFVVSNEKRERGNYLYARDDCLRAIEVYEKFVCVAVHYYYIA